MNEWCTDWWGTLVVPVLWCRRPLWAGLHCWQSAIGDVRVPRPVKVHLTTNTGERPTSTDTGLRISTTHLLRRPHTTAFYPGGSCVRWGRCIARDHAACLGSWDTHANASVWLEKSVDSRAWVGAMNWWFRLQQYSHKRILSYSLWTFPGNSLSRKDVSRKDVSRIVIFPERHFPDKTFPGQSLYRKDVSRKIIFPEK